jgi:hypothetical protein
MIIKILIPVFGRSKISHEKKLTGSLLNISAYEDYTPAILGRLSGEKLIELRNRPIFGAPERNFLAPWWAVNCE